MALRETYDPAPGTEAALECLTPAQLDDKQLVSVIKMIGRPPPFEAGKAHQFSPFHMEWVCEFLHSIPSPQMAASSMGCSARTFYRHRKKNQVFRELWDEAIAAGFQSITGAAAENALGVGDPDVLSRRSEKLLCAFLLRESRTKVDVEVEHKGGVIVISQPLTVEEFEKAVFEQQRPHRDQFPDSLGDARRKRSEPVIIDHDPGPVPPTAHGPSGSVVKQAEGGVVKLQSGQQDTISAQTRRPPRVVRSY